MKELIKKRPYIAFSVIALIVLGGTAIAIMGALR